MAEDNILSWIDVGKVSAEKDDLLTKYYFDSGLLARVSASPSCSLILGRKGAGKTAVFKYLAENNSRIIGNSDVLVPLSFEDYNWRIHSLLKNEDVAESLAYKQSWKFVFLVEAIKGYNSSCIKRGEDVPKSIAAASKLLEKLFSKPLPSIYDIIGKKILGLSNLSLPKAGFGLDGEDGPSLEFSGGEVAFEKLEVDATLRGQLSQTMEGIISHLESSLKNAMPLKGRVFLAFDRVDEAWDSISFESTKRIVAGLVSAAESFGLEYGRDVRVLVFLREDIFETLSINDKNKLREDSGALLKWDKDGLHRLLLERINYFARLSGRNAEKDIDALFDREKMRQGTTPATYMLKRGMMRPRDMICFYSKLISTMSDAAADPFGSETKLFNRLSVDSIYDAEPAYSEWLKKEIVEEWGVQRPEIGDLLTAIQNIGSTNVTENQLSEGLKRGESKFQGIPTQTHLKFLFENSIIGIKLGAAASWRYRCFHPTQGFVASDSYRVHDGLVRALNLTEPRAT